VLPPATLRFRFRAHSSSLSAVSGVQLSLIALALGVMGCGGVAAGTEPPAHPTPRPAALVKYVSSDGVHFRPGERRGLKGLRAVSWREMSYIGGQLILRDLADRPGHGGPHCGQVELVQIGPPRGRVRSVVAFARLKPSPCPVHVRLSPRGWRKDTIAAMYALGTANPHASTQQRNTAIPGTAVLQPDRRTIVVNYLFGGCRELADVSAQQRGRLILVSAVTGVRRAGEQTACAISLRYGSASVRLPQPAPRGAAVEVAPCGHDDEPPC
jgi:hypothetical protein